MNRKCLPAISAGLLISGLSLGVSRIAVANPAIRPNNTLGTTPREQLIIHCTPGPQPFINLAYSKYPNNADYVINNLRLASACIQILNDVIPPDLNEFDFDSIDFPDNANAGAEIEEFDLAYAYRLDDFREAYSNDQSLCWPDDIAVDESNAVTCANLEPDESESTFIDRLEELACRVFNCPE